MLSDETNINADASEGEPEHNLYQALNATQNPDEIQKLLLDLLTTEEIQIFARRWCVICHLLDGKDHYEIQKLCKASKNMVSRANQRVIKSGTGMSSEIYKRLKDDKYKS